jgi:hypothetical protein
MKQLNIEFTKGGIHYKQLERTESKAIYEQLYEEKNVGYEVIRIGSHSGLTLFGKEVPASETYPTTDSWGIRGWTYRTLDKAKEKYNTLK